MEAQRHAASLKQEEVPCSTDRTAGGALSREIVESLTRRDPIVFWARFWARVQKLDNGCWVWTGTKTSDGYGQITAGHPTRTRLLAHRVAFVYLYGPLAPGDDLLHGPCDNPLCVRHTRKGTQVENMRDMAERKRSNPAPRGSNNKRLGPVKAAEIRRRYAAGEKAPGLAAEFGIHYTGVYHIASGRCYPERGPGLSLRSGSARLVPAPVLG